ncbi:MAG: J domain-containing protein [Rubrobacter sp.]|nr:J domain-containing protein [Rubrobacter sp.]
MTVAGGTIHEPTYYEILGVSEDADKDEIRAAWLPLIQSIHPDHESDQQAREEATRQSALVNEAYNTLKNPRQRARYDAELQRRREDWQQARPKDQSSPEGYRHQTAEDLYEEHLTEEEEQELWERIQREAEEEAEAAWARYENPPLRERLAAALSELRDYDLEKVKLKGYARDSFSAQLELRRQRPEASLIFNKPVMNAIMASLALGELLVLGADLIYGAPVLLLAMAAALVLDYLLTASGARPLRYLATKAGSAVVLTEGQKLAAALTLAVRAVWAGVAAFFGAGLAVAFASSLAGVVAPVEIFRSVATQALVLVPIVWTIVVLALWAKKALTNDSTADDPEGN